MSITQEDLKILRAPFTVAAIKFRPAQKKPNRAGKVRCLTYIDSRLAVERLLDVDPSYEFRWEPLYADAQQWSIANFPTIGFLTVKGVTRQDVGQLEYSKVDDKYAKSAVSDALKRAAVQFGVGSYLYALGECAVSKGGYWTKQAKDRDGKPYEAVGGLNDDGVEELRSWYKSRIAHPSIRERFGDPINYGDLLLTDTQEEVDEPEVAIATESEPLVEAPPVETQPEQSHDDAILETIGEIAVAAGKRRASIVTWARKSGDLEASLEKTVRRAAKEGADRAKIHEALAVSGFDRLMEVFDGAEVK